MKTKLVSVVILITVLAAQGGLMPTPRDRAVSSPRPGRGSERTAASIAPAAMPPGPGTGARPADPRRFPSARASGEGEPPGIEGAFPVTFIPNRGQVDAHVRYYVQTGDHALWFSSGGVALDLSKAVLRLGFVDANPAQRLEANDRQRGVVSYFISNDPSRWRTGLPTYGEITYRDLWPGIDLSYQGHNGSLKSTFTVAPGADPAQIRLSYPDAERLSVSETGELVVRIGETELHESPPIAWQNIGGRQPRVAVYYQVEASGYTFALPDGYDAAYPLVIDPELTFSTFLGGSSNDLGVAVTVDEVGNSYVTGNVRSSDFPTTPLAFDPGYNGGSGGDAFVVKLNADGTGLEYATFLGGSENEDSGRGIAVDDQGHAYVVGRTRSSGFPTTPGAFDTSYNGSVDTFVVKLSADGAGLEYSTFLGGGSTGCPNDYANAIALDGTGHVYVTGQTGSADFPVTPDAFDTTCGTDGNCDLAAHYPACSYDAFVAKLNAEGTGLDYGTFLGGSDSEEGSGIAVDPTGNAFVTGWAGSSDFPATPGAFDTSNTGATDAFVVKLNPTGTDLEYATFLGGNIGSDSGAAIVVDGSGSPYVAGVAGYSDFPTTPGTYDTSYNASSDVFVAKLNDDGTGLEYATFLGGNDSDVATGIAIDRVNSVYVTGYTLSSDFPTTPGAYDTDHNGNRDVFVATLNASGTGLEYATFLGGSADDYAYAIASDGAGSAYVTGSTPSSGFPTTPGAYDTSHNGIGDVFVTHLALISYMLTQGYQALAAGRMYRENFHAELGGPASVTLADALDSYEASGLMHLSTAEAFYAAALRWAEPGSADATLALEGLLDTYWELATGAMLNGNEFMVQALDVAFENPSDPLAEEIGQLEEALNWYAVATEGYAGLLASPHYADMLALQPTRVDPISGQVTPDLDLQRLALAASKKSRAYLELAERQFRKFTLTSQAQAEATLREGIAQATPDLALLDALWDGALDDPSYQSLLRNLSDMQRIFRYLQEDKNPFGYGPEYVPFHFQPANLPKNNFQQTMDLAQAEKDAAGVVVTEAEGRQQQSDDNYVILQQRLADVVDKYDDQLIQLCGADPLDPTQPDLERCHENEAGEMYAQILRIEEATLRVQLVEQQMENQLALISIEQERAARVAGIHRATAEMYTATGEKLADLASEEVKLRERKTWSEKITGVVTGIVEGATTGAAFGPYGAIAGGIIGGLASTAQLFEEDAKTDQMGDLAAKRERLTAQQSAYVAYAEAEIEDANSEALIKQYMLRFTEYDIELSIAVNNLQQELARINGLKTEVEYLAAEKDNALAFTRSMYQDPAGRVLRDYYMELADDRFDVALRYAYRAARALEYEINQDAAFESGPLADLEDVYQVRDITTLGAALAQMNTAYNDFLARPDVPTPQQREDVIYLSEALGFRDAYDPDLGRVVTAEDKFNAFIRDPANRDEQGNLRFTFQTSIYLGNPFFSTGVFNDKIVSVQMRLRGTNLGNDRAVIYLRQDGTSFIRTVDALRSGGPDDVREYNVHPLKASVTAAINDNNLPAEVAVNRELATRSVAFTNWTLTLDQVSEPENQDVDLAGIREIEMTITHEAYTLQTLQMCWNPETSDRRGWGVQRQAASVPARGDRVAAARSAAPLSGTYIGTLTLSEPPGLTPLDLSIVLTDTAGSLSGYIDATQSPGYPFVSGPRGPSVSGAWTGDSLGLHSAPFADPYAGASRQVVLHTGVITDGGQILTGVYSETLWGLTPEPLVVVGEFRLARPAPLPAAGQAFDLQLTATSLRVEAGISTLLTAELVDFYSAPISQTQVLFSTDSGSLTPLTPTTDINGEAFATYTAADAPGWATITATSGSLVDTVQIEVVRYRYIYLPFVVKMP